MASTKSREMRVGIVTLAGLVVLIGGIVWGKGIGLGANNRVVQISFANAAGVEIGTPLTIKGVRKGAVTALDVRPDDVRITATIDATLPLKQDAEAILQMLEVTGGKKIELLTGNASNLLDANSVIPGHVQGDITSLLADVSEVGGLAKSLIRKVDSTVGMVNDLVGSREFRANLDNTLSNLEKSSADARDIVTDNKAAINRSIGNFDRLSTDLRELLTRSRPVVDRTLNNAEELSADAKRSVRKIDSTLRGVDTLIAQINDITTEIRKGHGAVSKLIYDKEFAGELDKTMIAVRSLIDDIEKSGIKTRITIGFGSK